MVTQTQEQKKWLDAKDVAKELNVHPKTVYGWWDAGKMQSWRLGGAGGPRRTTPEAMERFMVPATPQQTVELTPEQKRILEAKKVLAEFGL